MLFGLRTEKTGEAAEKTEGLAPAGSTVPAGSEASAAGTNKAAVKAKGHGRNAVTALTGAKKVPIPLTQYEDGEGCPECTGKLYKFQPRQLVRITGVAPLMAT